MFHAFTSYDSYGPTSDPPPSPIHHYATQPILKVKMPTAYALSRDQSVTTMHLDFGIPDHNLLIHYKTFMGLR